MGGGGGTDVLVIRIDAKGIGIFMMMMCVGLLKLGLAHLSFNCVVIVVFLVCVLG